MAPRDQLVPQVQLEQQALRAPLVLPVLPGPTVQTALTELLGPLELLGQPGPLGQTAQYQDLRALLVQQGPLVQLGLRALTQQCPDPLGQRGLLAQTELPLV